MTVNVIIAALVIWSVTSNVFQLVLGLIVVGSLLYYIPRYLRARRGINVSFVYKELPPE